MKRGLCSVLTVLLILSGIVQAQTPYRASQLGKIITDNVTTSKQLCQRVFDKSAVGISPVCSSPSDIDFTHSDCNYIDLFCQIGYDKQNEFLNPNRVPGGGTPWRFLWRSTSELVPPVRPADWSLASQSLSNTKGIRTFVSAYNNISEEYLMTIRPRRQKKSVSEVDCGQKFVINTFVSHPLYSENLSKTIPFFGVDWLETEIPIDEQSSDIDEQISILYSRWSALDYNLKHCLEQPKMNPYEFCNN